MAVLLALARGIGATMSVVSHALVAASRLLLHANMSRSATAYMLVPVGSFSAAVDEDDAAVFARATARIEPFRLEAALLASMPDDDDPSTLDVSPEENGKLLAAAFETTTIEARSFEPPVSLLPADLVEDVDRPSSVPETTGVRLTQRRSPPALQAPGTLLSRSSSVPQPVTPETTRAVREARELARAHREAEARVRRVVVVIWGAAVTLAGLFALYAIQS